MECPGNVIVLSPMKNFHFYVYLTKEIFHKNEFSQIELHAVGDMCIPTLAASTNILTKYGYIEIVRIKTKQVLVN